MATKSQTQDDKATANDSGNLAVIAGAALGGVALGVAAIYPALREAGEVAGADELTAEHGYVKQYLYELENIPNDSPKFLATVRKLRGDIENHMREEEDELFPRLKAGLSEEKNKHLTMMMNKEGFKLA